MTSKRWPAAHETIEAYRNGGHLPRQLSWFFLVLCEREDLVSLIQRYEELIQETEPGSKERNKCKYRLTMLRIHLNHKK